MIISIVLSTVVSAQPYSIFSFEGKVYVKPFKNEWKPAEKGMTIRLLDSLSINKRASVRLLDSKTNRIYEGTKIGDMAVYELVKQAEKTSDASVALVTKAVFKNIRPEQQSSMSSLGGVTRGSNENLTYEDTVASSIQKKISSKEYDDKLSVSKKRTRNGCFYFVINNQHDTPIFINILAIDNSDGVRLTFKPSDNGVIPIAQKRKLKLKESVFADMPGIEYIVFGTTTPFNSNRLETNMNIDSTYEKKLDMLPDIFISLIK